MTPRERLTEILAKRITDFLQEEGFKFNANKSQFTKNINEIKQIIYFEGSKWNYANAVADYQLLCRIEIKKFPYCYLRIYKTNQATHHQTKITEKSIHRPIPSEGYHDNWDNNGQSNRKYELTEFSSVVVEESMYKNLKECILPYLKTCSTYTGIAEQAKHPLDKFDFYMMDNNSKTGESVLKQALETIRKIRYVRSRCI
ncbi:MAG: hypothetical protein AAF223_03760 [Bacteroidota bacterium]